MCEWHEGDSEHLCAPSCLTRAGGHHATGMMSPDAVLALGAASYLMTPRTSKSCDNSYARCGVT